jgi:hypothetical protein
MKRTRLVVLVLLWTTLVSLGTARWVQRRAGAQPISHGAIEVAEIPHMTLRGEPWMLTSLRMSQGPNAMHVKREALSGGGLRIVVDDADGFSWDTVTIDLVKDSVASPLRASVKVDWTTDMGPQSGTWSDVTGWIDLSSSDLSSADPLVIQFTLRKTGGEYPDCVHGALTVPRL